MQCQTSLEPMRVEDGCAIYYEGPVVTRKQATARGLSYYFTGRRCKRGHVSQRILATGGHCVVCERSCARRHYGENVDHYRR